MTLHVPQDIITILSIVTTCQIVTCAEGGPLGYPSARDKDARLSRNQSGPLRPVSPGDRAAHRLVGEVAHGAPGEGDVEAGREGDTRPGGELLEGRKGVGARHGRRRLPLAKTREAGRSE